MVGHSTLFQEISRGVGGSDPKIDDGQAVLVGCRLHGTVLAAHRHVKALGEFFDVVMKVRQQDVLAELFNEIRSRSPS